MPLPLSIKELEGTPAAVKAVADAIDRHMVVLAALNSTLQGLGKTMHEEVAAFLVRIDTATNAIAARLDKLIAESNMPDELKATFKKEVERLEAMGKDPENPIPEVLPA